jgi:hypothetical protein
LLHMSARKFSTLTTIIVWNMNRSSRISILVFFAREVFFSINSM